jgi:hypothetical protein
VLTTFASGDDALMSCFLSNKGIAIAHANLARSIPTITPWECGCNSGWMLHQTVGSGSTALNEQYRSEVQQRGRTSAIRRHYQCCSRVLNTRPRQRCP